MKAIDKIVKEDKENIVEAEDLCARNRLDDFTDFVKEFGGSTSLLGMQIFGAWNNLMISTDEFKQLTALCVDNLMIEHLYDAWAKGLFDDSDELDDAWYLDLFTRFNFDLIVSFAYEWSIDTEYENFNELLRYWSCDAAGGKAIDLFSLDEIDFFTCRDIVQQCRVCGNLNNKFWLDRFCELSEKKGFDLDESWVKAYGAQQ